MPIPRRKVTGRGGGVNTVCVKSSQKEEEADGKPSKNTFVHFVQLLSLCLNGPNSGTGASDGFVHTENVIKLL